MTNDEKIKELKELRWQNLKKNLLDDRVGTGLCVMYYYMTNKNHPTRKMGLFSLKNNHPELYKNRTEFSFDFWWPSSFDKEVSKFSHWYYRHRAINKTIKQLKK